MENEEYAGILKRFSAFIVDLVIVSILGFVTFYSTKLFIMPSLDDESYGYFIFFIALFYFILLESSFLQATLGKLAGKMKVVNAHGERLSLLNAITRFFGKFLSYIPLGIGFLMIAFSKKKQGLHDQLAKTYVVKIDNYDELTKTGSQKILMQILKVLGLLFSVMLLFLAISGLLHSFFNSEIGKEVINVLSFVISGAIFFAIYKLFFKVTGIDEKYLAGKVLQNTEADIIGAFTNYDYKVQQKGDFTKSSHRTSEDAISMTKDAKNECEIYYKNTLLGVWYKGKKITDDH